MFRPLSDPKRYYSKATKVASQTNEQGGDTWTILEAPSWRQYFILLQLIYKATKRSQNPILRLVGNLSKETICSDFTRGLSTMVNRSLTIGKCLMNCAGLSSMHIVMKTRNMENI